MIKIKRVYEPTEDSDGFRVLVDRLWPRGLSKEKANIDLWMKDISPSNELRKWFSHDLEKWPEFRERYLNELNNKNTLLKHIIELEKEEGTLTLLYGAKDDEHNNAWVLYGKLTDIKL